MTQPELSEQLASIRTSIDATNSTVGQQGDKIGEMAEALSTFDGVVKGMAKSVNSVPTVTKLAPAIGAELSKVGDAVIAKLEERIPNAEALAALQTSLDATTAALTRSGNALIHVEAANTNQKVVKAEDGSLGLEKKGFFDHAWDYGKPVLIGGAATVLGIAAWETGRWGVDKVFGPDDMPADI
jgi:hypothetical protein